MPLYSVNIHGITETRHLTCLDKPLGLKHTFPGYGQAFKGPDVPILAGPFSKAGRKVCPKAGFETSRIRVHVNKAKLCNSMDGGRIDEQVHRMQAPPPLPSPND